MMVSLAPEKSGITCELKFVFFFFFRFFTYCYVETNKNICIWNIKNVSHASAIIKRLKGITADQDPCASSEYTPQLKYNARHSVVRDGKKNFFMFSKTSLNTHFCKVHSFFVLFKKFIIKSLFFLILYSFKYCSSQRN